MPSPNHNGPIIDRDATAHWDRFSLRSQRQRPTSPPVAAIARLDHRSAHRPIPVRRPRLAVDDKDGDDPIKPKQKKGSTRTRTARSKLRARSSGPGPRLLRSCIPVYGARRWCGAARLGFDRSPAPASSSPYPRSLSVSLSLCSWGSPAGLPMKLNVRRPDHRALFRSILLRSGGENQKSQDDRPCNRPAARARMDGETRRTAPHRDRAPQPPLLKPHHHCANNATAKKA